METLINFDDDPWLLELSQLKRLAHQIKLQITERNRISTNHGVTQEYNKHSAKLRIQLKQFENEMIQLEKKLRGKNRTITEPETERRLRELELLASEKIKLDDAFRNTPGSSSRDQLFDKHAKLFDDDDDELVVDKVSVEAYRSEQTNIMRQQDAGLENLSQVIARQKKLALKIGNEIEDQNEIIENIASQIDSTAESVAAETRHVERVSEKDSTWSYWLVILCLFIAIIVVGIL